MAIGIRITKPETRKPGDKVVAALVDEWRLDGAAGIVPGGLRLTVSGNESDGQNGNRRITFTLDAEDGGDEVALVVDHLGRVDTSSDVALTGRLSRAHGPLG